MFIHTILSNEKDFIIEDNGYTLRFLNTPLALKLKEYAYNLKENKGKLENLIRNLWGYPNSRYYSHDKYGITIEFKGQVCNLMHHLTFNDIANIIYHGG